MLTRFFQARRRVGPPSTPTGTIVYAIGDIHGRFDLIRILRDLIVADARQRPPERRVVVFLGDYVDRGLESRQVVDFLVDDPFPGFETICLLGNHERTMLDFLDDESVAREWFQFGGRETLLSYGVKSDAGLAIETAALQRMQSELRTNLPASHEVFLRSLKLMHVEGDYVFVHAGIRPGVRLNHQVEGDLLWIRDEFLESEEDHGKIVVHGHTVTATAVIRPNRIGIDTGAYISDQLTCLVLSGAERTLLVTGKKKAVTASADDIS